MGIKKKESNKIIVTISIIVIILLLILIVNIDKIIPKIEQKLRLGDKSGEKTEEQNNEGKTIAIVNGYEIKENTLNKEYQKLGTELQALITKEKFLNESIIPQIILLQEADKLQIKDEDIQKTIKEYLEQTGSEINSIEELAQNYNLTTEEIKNQIKIIILFNRTIFKNMDVSEDEIKEFYKQNKEYMKDENGIKLKLEEIKEDVKAGLLVEKQKQAVKEYIEELRKRSEIKILNEELTKEDKNANKNSQKITIVGSTFTETNEDICKEGEKPVVNVYATTNCPQCQVIKEPTLKVLKEYEGKIKAQYFEIDTKKELISGKEITKEDVELFKKYNKEEAIPFFIVGCKYTRIGKGFIGKEINKEEEELKAIINKIV